MHRTQSQEVIPRNGGLNDLTEIGGETCIFLPVTPFRGGRRCPEMGGTRKGPD